MQRTSLVSSLRSRRQLFAPCAALGLALLLHAPGVRAQRANYNDVILGGRAGAMGGAFTAVANDASAVYHNPAGIAGIYRHDLSLSVGAYGFQRATIDKRLRSGSMASTDLTLDSILVFPSTASYVFPLGGGDKWHHSAAISILVPEFFEYEGHQPLDADETQVDLFSSVSEKTYLAGPSYGIHYGPFYIGGSLFAQYTALNLKQSVQIADRTAASQIERGNEFEFTEARFFGLTANLGMLVRPTPALSFGATLWLPNMRLGGNANTFAAESLSRVQVDAAGNPVLDADGNPVDVTVFQDVYRNIEGRTRYETAPSLALGAAYTRPKLITVAFDLDLYFPNEAYNFIDAKDLPPPPPSPGELGSAPDARGFSARVRDPGRTFTTNVSLGADYWISSEWSVLAGLFTDASAVPDEGVQFLDQIDLWGASVGLTKRSENSVLTVGVTGRYGAGQSFALDVAQAVPRFVTTDATQWSLGVFVAGSTRESEDDDGEESGVTELL